MICFHIMSTSLIVIGGTGELGQQVLEAACSDLPTGWPGNVIATYLTSLPRKKHPRLVWQKLDCSDHKEVRSLIASQSSLGAVLYCAVPKHGGAAEKGGDSVRAGIVEDVVNCAESVVMLGARFVAVSTDIVFDGSLPPGQLYSEQSPPGPRNAYGRYKVEMENRLLSLSGKVIIARTSLILTVEENNYGKGVQFVIDCLTGKHGEIEMFSDELRSMSFSDDLGLAMLELSKEECKHNGLIHMVTDEVANRWELTKLLAKKLGMENMLGVHAKNGLSSESGLNRPINCGMSTELCRSVLKTKIRGITERLS